MKLPHTERGEGPAVVLLHAGIAHRGMWDEHLEPLAAGGHRVIAVDLPGFGDAVPEDGPVAHWEDVVETMDALEIGRAVLLGNSFGAAVALRAAALHPLRFAALLLFSAGDAPEPEPSAQLLAAWEAEEQALEAGDARRAAEAVASSWVRPEASEEVRRRVAAMQRRNYEHRAAEDREQAPDPLEEEPALIARITCPVLLVAGERDMVDFTSAPGKLAEKLPDARTTEIPACGHLPPLEAPDRFRALVIESLVQQGG
jgi:pimeloyl-ACP methyl ester carboxylesterase